jgi:hypothetical protein
MIHMKKIILLFCYILCSGLALHAQERFIARIHAPSGQLLESVMKSHLDIAACKPGEFLDLVLDEAAFNQFKSEGLDITVYMTGQQLKDNLRSGKELTAYRNYSELLTELQQIQATHPAICQLYNIGQSQGKIYAAGGNTNYQNYQHDIWALKVSDNVSAEEDEPCVYYFGNHHAREPISVEVAMYVLNYILSQYGTNPTITNQVNNTQIWFVPLVNPDGHKIVIDETDVWWRKNIRDNNNNGVIDPETGYSQYPDGVDLNRNYSFEWGGQGTSFDPTDETYCGPYGFSEPELYGIRDLMLNHHFVAGISYHSYGELVLYPFGYANNIYAPDQIALNELAVQMANSIPAAGGGYYTPQPSWQLYPCSGTTDDFAYGEKGIFGYTIELTTTFIPAGSQIQTICQDNLQAALTLLNRVNISTLTGHVLDAGTNLPVTAQVYVAGVDNTGEYRAPYISDAGFGRYYRLLKDGTYTVTFSAYGYLPQTFQNVSINDLAQTILDVYLVPAQSYSVTGTVTDHDTGLPIENASVQVLDTPIPVVYTNALGQYTIPTVYEGTYDFKVFKQDYSTLYQQVSIAGQNVVADFQLYPSTAWSFELGTFESLWVMGGNAPWTITTQNPYDGNYCAKSGAIGNSQTSTMSITLDLLTAGNVSFFRKVSSEAGYDFLEFYIDNTKQDQWSGELPWAEVAFQVTGGTHTFKWVYSKDAYTVSGSDCAWVDYIIFPPINMAAILQLQSLTIDDSGTGNGNGRLDAGETANAVLTIYNSGLSQATNVAAQLSSLSNYLTVLNTTANAGNIAPNSSQTATFQVSVSSGTPQGTLVDFILTAVSGPVSAQKTFYKAVGNLVADEDFETGNFLKFAWVQGGNGPWVITNSLPYQGTYCAKSGTITHNQTSELSVTLDVLDNGQISFYRKVSSETNYDWLRFYIDGVQIERWSGTKAWAQVTYTVTAGVHTFKWAYTKDGNTSTGSDCGWIDLIDFPPVRFSSTVDLKAFLEGPFNGSSMNVTLNTAGYLPLSQPYGGAPWSYPAPVTVAAIPNASVVDWVLVEFRETAGAASTATSATTIGKQAAFLLSNGSIVTLDGSTELTLDAYITKNLYAVIYHRNHLPVMSASALSKSGGVYTYDFSSGVNQVYGGANGHKLLGGTIYGLVGADGDANGTVSNVDKIDIWIPQSGSSGYKAGDFNMNGNVNNQDKIDIWAPNSGRSSQVP